jgi:YD repeat-containing protein
MSNNEPIFEYNDDGNCIYYKNSDGYEWWKEYDTNGNEIHCKDSHGNEQWSEYHPNGKLIHYKNSAKFEFWQEFDFNGKCIHYKNSTGFEEWWEYDYNGKLIYHRNNDGFEYWYDADGNEIDKPTEKKDNDTMSNNNTQTYVIEFQDGSFYAKYEDDRETNRLFAADTFTLKEAIEKVKSLNCECKIREYIPATLGQEINPKQNILDALYLSSAEASKLNNPVLCGRIKEVIEMVKEYM